MEPHLDRILDSYKLGSSHFDEVFKELKSPKEHYQSIVDHFNQLTLSDYERINNEVKSSFLIKVSRLRCMPRIKSPMSASFHSICFLESFQMPSGWSLKKGCFNAIRLSISFWTISTTKGLF